jgi:hypothetical protein
LGCEGPATGSDLCANFIRLNAKESLHLRPNATSQVFYVIQGSSTVVQGEHTIEWSKGCFLALRHPDRLMEITLSLCENESGEGLILACAKVVKTQNVKTPASNKSVPLPNHFLWRNEYLAVPERDQMNYRY